MPEKDIFAEDSEVEVIADIPQQVEIQEYAGEVEVGEVTTLPAGSDATVTNTGTATHAVLNFGLPKGDSGSEWGEISGTLSDQTDLNTALTNLSTSIGTKAPANNAVLTGLPTAPTAADNTNTTQVATTAFVQNAITLLRNEINARISTMLGRMDFSNMQEVTASWTRAKGQSGAVTTSPFTAPSNGYIYFKSFSTPTTQLSTKDVDFKINDGVLYNFTGATPTVNAKNDDDLFRIGNMLPVAANDVISVDGKATYSSNNAITYSMTFLFIPQVL